MKILFIILALFKFVLSLKEPATFTARLADKVLTPYTEQHGSMLDHDSIRDCQLKESGSAPHELYPAPKPISTVEPFFKIRRFVREVPVSRDRHRAVVRGHVVTVFDPVRALSVLEPDQVGGCELNIRQTVVETARKGKCLVAVNAGYFDTKKGSCLGNVISDGHKAHSSKGVQNTHFGIKNGSIFVGYLSEEEFLKEDFQQLVGGVVWILRNGTSFVNASSKLECEDTEETGPMQHFVSVLSARTAVGHDLEGNVVIVQVDGKSEIDGINLFGMEHLLKSFGLVNAINLDGGGSSTLVREGITLNYPYDQCDGDFSCDRKVSSILCIHEPYCEPRNCSNHGTCSLGQCLCNTNWLPPNCDRLFCAPNNCSYHGLCLENGCSCHPGFFGKFCNQTCEKGWYGSMCSNRCDCINSAECDPLTGSCLCKSGFTGEKCEHSCPIGYFGTGCQQKCKCASSCYCDPVSGDCDVPLNSSLHQTSTCLAKNLIQEQHLIKDNAEERRKWYLALLVLGCVTAFCVAALVLILCCSCSCRCQNEQVLCFKREKKRYRKVPLQVPSGYLSDSTSDEIYPLNNLQKS